MPAMPVAIMGTLNSHSGPLVATGAKLLVSGAMTGLFGDPFLPKCVTPSHTGSTLAPVTRKLLVTGRMIAAQGDLCSCSALVVGPLGVKLLVL